MERIVGVKFKNTNKIYYFSPNGLSLALSDDVIVETKNGLEMGKIVLEERDLDIKLETELKPVIRKATAEDFKNIDKHQEKKEHDVKIIAEKVRECNLDMKILDVDYTIDSSKMIVSFSSENRVDFRNLVKDLATIFKTRIELKQVCARDEAKLLGGIAPCGRICCCKQYLTDFNKVSIKMAKSQGLSLNPTKISGLCGRLMCCLEYEHEYYNEVSKEMPKPSSEVLTVDGKGEVVSNNMLKRLVKVKITGENGDFTIKDYPLEEIKCKKHVENKPKREESEEKE